MKKNIGKLLVLSTAALMAMSPVVTGAEKDTSEYENAVRKQFSEEANFEKSYEDAAEKAYAEMTATPEKKDAEKQAQEDKDREKDYLDRAELEYAKENAINELKAAGVTSDLFINQIRKAKTIEGVNSLKADLIKSHKASVKEQADKKAKEKAEKERKEKEAKEKSEKDKKEKDNKKDDKKDNKKDNKKDDKKDSKDEKDKKDKKDKKDSKEDKEKKSPKTTKKDLPKSGTSPKTGANEIALFAGSALTAIGSLGYISLKKRH